MAYLCMHLKLRCIFEGLSLRKVIRKLACENIRFSSLFAAGDVSRETSPAAKSEQKRMFSQANYSFSQANPYLIAKNSSAKLV